MANLNTAKNDVLGNAKAFEALFAKGFVAVPALVEPFKTTNAQQATHLVLTGRYLANIVAYDAAKGFIADNGEVYYNALPIDATTGHSIAKQSIVGKFAKEHKPLGYKVGKTVYPSINDALAAASDKSLSDFYAVTLPKELKARKIKVVEL